MKNLGKIENKKDIATLGNIIEIPYGTILTIPKQMTPPKGFIEWNTPILANDYPHLIDLFGITNIVLQEYTPKMINNTSNPDFYIDEARSSVSETVDGIEELYKIFNSDLESPFIMGNDRSEEHTFYKSINVTLGGNLIDGLYEIRDKVQTYGVKYSVVQSNNSIYTNPIGSFNVTINGAATISTGQIEQVKPGETVNKNIEITTFVSQFYDEIAENRRITCSFGITSSPILSLKNVKFILPLVDSKTYIDVPIDWAPGVGMNSIIKNKQSKLIMYVGNSIK